MEYDTLQLDCLLDISACWYVSFLRAFSNSICFSLAVRSFPHTWKQVHGALEFGRFQRWYENIWSEHNDFQLREIEQHRGIEGWGLKGGIM